MIDKKNDSERSYFMIDVHHHIGEDIDGNENLPIGSNGSYQFSKDLEEDVIGALKETNSRYEAADEGVIKNFDDQDDENYPYGLLDQMVVFPMKDRFRNDGKIPFSRSNENISEWINSEYHHKRLLGFGRLDPSDIDMARKEVERFPLEYGLVGLKIHPDSERFHLDSQKVIQLYIDCAKMNLPIIFHTGYPSDVEKIHEGVNKTISLLIENGLENLISQLNIIVGHCSYEEERVFDFLSHPCIYGEMSTLKSPESFIGSARENIKLSNFTNKTLKEFNEEVRVQLKSNFWKIFDVNSHWSGKLMLGTDHPFLPGENIVKLFEALFSSELSEDLEPTAIQNILGRNLIGVLPVTAELSSSFYMKNRS